MKVQVNPEHDMKMHTDLLLQENDMTIRKDTDPQVQETKGLVQEFQNGPLHRIT